MKNQVISSPPVVVQGLIRPVTGVLEYLRVLSHLCFCVELTHQICVFSSHAEHREKQEAQNRSFSLGITLRKGNGFTANVNL